MPPAGSRSRGPRRSQVGEAQRSQGVEHRTSWRRVPERRLERLTLRPSVGSRGFGPYAGVPAAPPARGSPLVAHLPGQVCANHSRTRPDHLGYDVPADPTGQLPGVLVAQGGVLIWATIGTQWRRALTALGAVEVVFSPAVRIMNSNNGFAGPGSRRAPSPEARRRSWGSSYRRPPPPRNHPAGFCSPPETFRAAACQQRRRRRRHESARRGRTCRPSSVAADRQVLVAERRPARGDRGGDASRCLCHHAGVALDDDGLMTQAMSRLARSMPNKPRTSCRARSPGC